MNKVQKPEEGLATIVANAIKKTRETPGNFIDKKLEETNKWLAKIDPIELQAWLKGKPLQSSAKKNKA